MDADQRNDDEDDRVIRFVEAAVLDAEGNGFMEDSGGIVDLHSLRQMAGMKLHGTVNSPQPHFEWIHS